MRMLHELFNHKTPAGRCLIGIAASVPFFLWQGASYVSALGDPAVNAPVLKGIIGLFIVGTLIELVTGLWLWPRRHSPAPVFGASMVLALTITLVFSAVMIAFGAFTSGANLIPVGLLAIGLYSAFELVRRLTAPGGSRVVAMTIPPWS